MFSKLVVIVLCSVHVALKFVISYQCIDHVKHAVAYDACGQWQHVCHKVVIMKY